MSNKFLGIDLDLLGRGIRQSLGFLGGGFLLLLPKKVQSKLQVGDEALVVALNSKTVDVFRIEKGNHFVCFSEELIDNQLTANLIDVIKSEINNDRRLTLSLPDDKVLNKEIIFPISVLENLKQTVYYELDKHTPFKKTDLYYDVVVKSKTSINIIVQLFVIHKKEVENILLKFKQSGIYFDSIGLQSYPEVNLLPKIYQRKRPLVRVSFNMVLIFCIVIMMIAAALVPLYLKRLTLDQLSDEVATLTTKAAGERELIIERDDKVELVTSFVDSRPIPIIHIIEDLSEKLDDNSWVSLLTFQNNRFTIRGESADATALIKILSDDPLYQQVEFVSPIVRSRTNDKEQFRIGFSLSPNARAQATSQEKLQTGETLSPRPPKKVVE